MSTLIKHTSFLHTQHFVTANRGHRLWPLFVAEEVFIVLKKNNNIKTTEQPDRKFKIQLLLKV